MPSTSHLDTGRHQGYFRGHELRNSGGGKPRNGGPHFLHIALGNTPATQEVGGRIAHVGTHGIRNRSTTDIANSGIPVKVGMALTAHKTVAMFMRYVHTEDDPVRKAAELVANRRKTVVMSKQPATQESTTAA